MLIDNRQDPSVEPPESLGAATPLDVDALPLPAPKLPAPLERRLIARRSKIAELFHLGQTLLRELHTPGAKAFDPTFPLPFSLTDGGPAYFEVAAVWAWVRSRQAKAALERVASKAH